MIYERAVKDLKERSKAVRSITTSAACDRQTQYSCGGPEMTMG